MREYLTVFFESILLSSLLFSFVKIQIMVYIIPVFLIWIILWLNINLEKNERLVIKILTISYSTLIAFIGSHYEEFLKPITLYYSIILLGVGLVLLFLEIYLLPSDFSQEKSTQGELFYKRQKDLEKVAEYVEQFNIVGVDAVWGDGKTFLVQRLKEKLGNSYEFVEIDIISCNLDELPNVLVKELEKILYRHRIISEYSTRLKEFFSKEKRLGKLYDLLGGTKYSYSEMFHGFQKELLKIDKKVLFIYEDIDRISNQEMIRKIFYISEKMTCHQVKILYQYSGKRLEEIGFDREYLDKYIPYNIKLSYIGLREIAADVFIKNDFQKDVLNYDDLYMLSSDSLKTKGLLEKKGINVDYERFFKDKYNIRAIEHFLTEVYTALNEDTVLLKNKEIVIAFFFIKHFIPEIYKGFSIFKSSMDCFKIEFEDQSYTIPLIMEHVMDKNHSLLMKQYYKDALKQVFCEKENIERYIAFTLFGFKEYMKPDEENDPQKRVENIYNESEKDLRDKVEYETQDRIIWHLLESGKSLKNNYWYVADNLIEKVLNKPEAEWSVAFHNFCNDLYHEVDEIIDNRTIFLFGVDVWVELFKAFFLVRASAENYQKLINLFWRKAAIQEFNVFFVKNINPCLYGIGSRNLYIFLLKKINELQFKGNLNNEKYFLVFLERSMLALYQLGYSHRIDPWVIRDTFSACNNANDEYIISILGDIGRNLERYKNEFEENPALADNLQEFTVISSFVTNMIRVIEKKEKCLDNRSLMNRNSIVDSAADNFNRYLTLDDNEFEQELVKIKEKMNPAQIYNLLRQRKRKKSIDD